MLKSFLLFAVSVLVTLLSKPVSAQATEKAIGLNFELPPMAQAIQSMPIAKALPARTVASHTDYKTSESILKPVELRQPIEQLAKPKQPLPPIEEALPLEISPAASNKTNSEEGIGADAGPDNSALAIGVQFQKDSIALPNKATEAADASQAKAVITKQKYSAPELDDWIFEGGSTSLVAHTVGSAEGTRYRDGKRTKAYYGHKDPGNGVWNLGTFSYQHKAHSPEDADARQLKRLKHQGIQLEEMAKLEGVQLSLAEKLNGLDLANQAPLAALGKGGYIERLAQARRLKLENEEAIVWARTRAYLDPDTRAWNAPGLGNTLHSISQDQARRMSAIATALQAYRPASAQVTDLSQLDAISLEKSDLSASSFGSNATDIAIQFELSERDISQSLDEANRISTEALALETEIAILAPLKSKDSRGNRPTLNRSWWRTEDKVVRRK